MSKPSTTPATRSQDPRSTRQLLDELDALMEKMLILPVEDPPPPRTPSEPAPPAVAATLTLFDATPPADRAAFEVGAEETESVAADDLLNETEDDAQDSVEDDAEEEVDDEVEDEVEDKPTISRWRPLTKKIRLESDEEDESTDDESADDESAGEDVDEEIVEDDEPVASGYSRGYSYAGSTEEQEADDEHAESPFFAPPAPAVSDRNPVYENGLKFELGFRRATRSFGVLGWAVNTPAGRMVLGLLGLAMWAGAAAWLARDYMQWPR